LAVKGSLIHLVVSHERARLSWAAILAFCWIAVLAPAQRSPLTVADRDAAVRADVAVELNGKALTPTDPIPLGATPTLRVTASWTGKAETMSYVGLVVPSLAGATLVQTSAAPIPANIAGGSAQGDRWEVAWTLPLNKLEQAGSLSVMASTVEYKLAGYDRTLTVATAPWSGTIVAPSKWMGRILNALVVGLVIAFAILGGRWLMHRFSGRERPSDIGPLFLTDNDPTAFERIHAELTSIETKVHIEDIEGFFRKLRPLVYSFAQAIEGPRVIGLSSGELRTFFETSGTDAKQVHQKLLEYLQACDEFDATGRELPAQDCLAIIRNLRHMAAQCAERAARRA